MKEYEVDVKQWRKIMKETLLVIDVQKKDTNFSFRTKNFLQRINYLMDEFHS